MKNTGGLSELKEANEEVCDMITNISEEILSKLGIGKENTINTISYKTQVVAGIIYYTKINISDKHYHLKVMSYLPHENKGTELISIKDQETKLSDIKYF